MFITTLAIIMTDGIIQLAQIWGNSYMPLLKFTDHVVMLKGTLRPCLPTSGTASRSAHGSHIERQRVWHRGRVKRWVTRGRSFGFQADRMILLFSGLVLIVSITFKVDYSLIWIIWIHIFVCESEVAQSCLTLWDPMDCSLPGSSVYGIFQARILEWVAISFSRRSSQPRDWTRVSCIVGRCFTAWATREVLCIWSPQSLHWNL